MENQSLPVVARLIALLAISGSVWAADGSQPDQEADWQQRLERAAALQTDSKAQQAAADHVLEQAEAGCHKKFRVNACLSEVRSEHKVASREAKRLEIQSKALEREVKKEQLADKDRRRAETGRQHEADLRVREAETAAARQAGESEAATTRAAKARKAEEGERRKAADEEKQRKKRADHEARVAKKMHKAERQAVEAAKP